MTEKTLKIRKSDLYNDAPAHLLNATAINAAILLVGIMFENNEQAVLIVKIASLLCVPYAHFAFYLLWQLWARGGYLRHLSNEQTDLRKLSYVDKITLVFRTIFMILSLFILIFYLWGGNYGQ